MNYLNKITLLILSVFLTFQFSINAQDLNLKWSDQMEYANGKDGFFSELIGSNENYIYAFFTNISITSATYSKIKIVAFDKQTLKKVNSVAIKGYKDNAEKKSNYKKLKFFKVQILKNEIYVFWNQITNTKVEKKEDLFVEVFDLNLDRKTDLKKVFTADLESDVKLARNAGSTITILSNKEAGDGIVVGYELPQKDDNVQFIYTVLNPDLELEEIKKVDLPIKLNSKKSYGRTSSYSYGKDGNIYISSYITLSKEERKEAAKGENLSYCVLSVINPETEDFAKIELKKENYNINDFSFQITESGIKIYGFFCDLEKDPKGYSTHGIFRTKISGENLEDSGIEFTYFDKSTISKLFEKDKEDLKPVAKKSKKKKAAPSNEEALDPRFGIENIFITDKDEVVLFCSKMRNYSVTTCTSSPNGGGQTCTTRYYCEKSNVTVIKLSNEGEIIWASNLDRKMTYSGTSILDLKVIFKDNKFYVIYGSAFGVDADKKNGKSRKKMSEYRDTFEYAFFENETGKYKKNVFIVNDKTVTEKKERKSVNALNITTYDDCFYVNYMKVRPWSYLYCGYCLLFAPDMVKANGNLGVISVIENTGGKKKKK
ncbi:MAG: hypothetical protein HYR91_13065 [Flavobacteriia bacterium]|nr:hypothetical protein [Flavobacteriia bacterium]